MRRIKLFEEYEMTPGNLERQNVINKRVTEITVKKEIENEIVFLEKLIRFFLSGRHITDHDVWVKKSSERIKILKSLLETL
jgi:hypothetical protein